MDTWILLTNNPGCQNRHLHQHPWVSLRVGTREIRIYTGELTATSPNTYTHIKKKCSPHLFFFFFPKGRKRRIKREGAGDPRAAFHPWVHCPHRAARVREPEPMLLFPGGGGDPRTRGSAAGRESGVSSQRRVRCPGLCPRPAAGLLPAPNAPDDATYSGGCPSAPGAPARPLCPERRTPTLQPNCVA